MDRGQRDTALFSEPGQGKATVMTQNGFPRHCVSGEINKHTGAFMKNEFHSSLLQTDPVWASVPSVTTNNAPLILKTLISKWPVLCPLGPPTPALEVSRMAFYYIWNRAQDFKLVSKPCVSWLAYLPESLSHHDLCVRFVFLSCWSFPPATPTHPHFQTCLSPLCLKAVRHIILLNHKIPPATF